VSTARVDFTRGAAERIAAVVRQVEGGNRDGAPLTFQRVDCEGSGKAIRFCSWSSTWPYNATTTITFWPGPANTATARNVILGVAPGDGWVAKRSTAGWALVAFDLTKQPGYTAGAIQLFGHSSASSAVAQWYSITTCATATA
jgi:hypothetical protein